MSGDIDMATNKILNLPAPTADEEPTRKADLATHAALETGIHGLKGKVTFSAHQTSNQDILSHVNTTLNWHAEEWDIGSYFDLVNNRYKPLIPGKYLFILGARLNSMADGDEMDLLIYKNDVYTRMLNFSAIGAPCYPSIVGSTLLIMNGTTDYVKAHIYHTNPATKQTTGTQETCFFQGFLIAQT